MKKIEVERNFCIHGTTAQFPGYTLHGACLEIAKGVVEGFGQVHMEHVQLCPQSSDCIDESTVLELQQSFPDTQFRLHANVRIDSILRIYDASRYSSKTHWYYERLAELSTRMNAPAYSLHAGYRNDACLEKMYENVRTIQSFFSCPVIVEGMYPSERKDWLVRSWEEYGWVMESGLYYAIDLSHINILKRFWGCVEEGLLEDLLLHPNCKEIHLSYNFGNQDSHLQLSSKKYKQVWWREIWLSSMKKRQQQGLTIPTHFTEGRCAVYRPNREKIERGNVH